MKKIIFILLVFLATTATAGDYGKEFLQTLQNDGKESTATVYNDGKESVSAIYNDAKSVVSTVYTDGKSAVSELYPDVKSAIISIAQGIGIAAEHVYEVLVKKYVVIGVVELLIFILAAFLLIFGFVSTYKYINSYKVITWKIVFPVLLIVIGGITAYNVNYYDMLMGIINPEFGAINYILEYARGIM